MGYTLRDFHCLYKEHGAKHLNELDSSETFYSDPFETISDEDGSPKTFFIKIDENFYPKVEKTSSLLLIWTKKSLVIQKSLVFSKFLDMRASLVL